MQERQILLDNCLSKSEIFSKLFSKITRLILIFGEIKIIYMVEQFDV